MRSKYSGGLERVTSKTPKDRDLEALMREFAASGIAELHVKTGDFDLFLSKDPNAFAPGAGAVQTTSARSVPQPPTAQAAASSSTPPAAAAPPAIPASAELPSGCIAVRAPYLGTFYRAPKPGEPNFVEIGDAIEVGRDLCLVEVMKLFTAVRAEVAGTVRTVYAVDGQMVEEGQLLFALDPKG
jgi:acetyl-CoA carboxylase biotin carboxyl carrier protein